MPSSKKETTLFMIIGLVLLCASLALLGFLVQRDFKAKTSSRPSYFKKQEVADTSEKKPQPSETSDTFHISGKGAELFDEITFKPFKVKPGSSQKLSVTLKNPDQIKKVSARLEDGTGFKERELKKQRQFSENDQKKALYVLTWQPEGLEYKSDYKIDFQYETKDGEKNTTTLFWQTIEKLDSSQKEAPFLADFSSFFSPKVAKAQSFDFFFPDGSVSGPTFDSSSSYGSTYVCSAFNAEGNVTINSSCYVDDTSRPIGLNDGDLTVDGGETLQLNSNVTFRFNNDQSIYPNGLIALSESGAKIDRGRVCYNCDDPPVDAECGTHDNGCGGTVSCGGCSGDTSCGYGSCDSDEEPSWSCSGGTCDYSCSYDSSCTSSGGGGGDCDTTCEMNRCSPGVDNECETITTCADDGCPADGCQSDSDCEDSDTDDGGGEAGDTESDCSSECVECCVWCDSSGTLFGSNKCLDLCDDDRDSC